MGCNHEYTTYVGLAESFEYCRHCDHKKGAPEKAEISAPAGDADPVSGRLGSFENPHAGVLGEPATNPSGPSSGSYRVIRGGSWGNSPQDLRSALRGNWWPGGRYDNVGFRLLREPTGVAVVAQLGSSK